MGNVTVDFYRYSGATIADISTAMNNLLTTKRSLGDEGRVFELRNLDNRASSLFGHIRKTQQTDLPMKSTIGGDDEELGLDENQGLGYRGFFLVDGHREWLLWIGSRAIGGPGLLRRFLELEGVNIELGVLVADEGWRRLEEHQDAIKEFRIRVAATGGTVPHDVSDWQRSQLQAIKDTHANFMDVSFGVDLRLGSNPLSRSVMDKVRGLLSRNLVDRARVTFMPGEQVDPIDLLEDRVKYVAPVPTLLQSMSHDVAYKILSSALTVRG